MSNDTLRGLADLQQLADQFCQDRDWDQFHGLKDLAIGLSTESNELLQLFRFKTEQEANSLLSQPARREAIEDELADVLFFLLRFSSRANVDLSHAFRRKLSKNALKYPVDVARGSNLKYSERDQK